MRAVEAFVLMPQERSVLAVPGDLRTATETFSGPGFKVTAPGRGVVFLQTGRRVFEPNGDIIVHGSNTGSAELCAALS